MNSLTELVPGSPRYLACLRQCRIARLLSGEAVFDGSCPCDLPSECRFELKSELTEENAMFPDKKFFYNQMWTE